MGKFSDQYRPERHYMRGPGPKWHEKHAAALLSAASAQPKASGRPEGQPKAARPPAAKVQHLRHSLWIVPITVAALLGFVVVAFA